MYIKIFKSAILALFTIFVLSSCATKTKYIDQQKTWIGQNIGAYIIKFGYPNNILAINSDDKAYVYTKTMINPEAGRYGAPTESAIFMQVQHSPNFAQMYALNCTTWVVVDKQTKTIKNITFRGNYCVSDN
jgi:hypothetical protein